MNDTTRDSNVSALLLGEFETDRNLLRQIFRKSGWRLFEARDLSAGLDCLARVPVEVVIAETETQDWNWQSVLKDLRRMDHPPQLVVTSRIADDYLWAEVLNVGGFDVLAQPLDRDEVERVVASACRQYYRRPAVRATGDGLAAFVA